MSQNDLKKLASNSFLYKIKVKNRVFFDAVWQSYTMKFKLHELIFNTVTGFLGQMFTI